MIFYDRSIMPIPRVPINSYFPLTNITHINLITLRFKKETPKYVVLAFELMSGGDLYKYLCARGTTAAEISLTEIEAQKLFLQVLSGVNYAHTHNIIHRDLKLDNLLLKDATLREVKIADFGLSEYYRPGGTLNSHRGTLSFQAPEIFSGSNYAGPPLDVWALGVILFALLSGRLPFEGPELNSLKRPRDQIIRQKIVNCQYKLDEHISSDGKVCNLPPLTYPYVCTLSYIHIYPLLHTHLPSLIYNQRHGNRTSYDVC